MEDLSTPADEEQVREALAAALTDQAPPALVRLVGKQAYTRCDTGTSADWLAPPVTHHPEVLREGSPMQPWGQEHPPSCAAVAVLHLAGQRAADGILRCRVTHFRV